MGMLESFGLKFLEKNPKLLESAHDPLLWLVKTVISDSARSELAQLKTSNETKDAYLGNFEVNKNYRNFSDILTSAISHFKQSNPDVELTWIKNQDYASFKKLSEALSSPLTEERALIFRDAAFSPMSPEVNKKILTILNKANQTTGGALNELAKLNLPIFRIRLAGLVQDLLGENAQTALATAQDTTFSGHFKAIKEKRAFFELPPFPKDEDGEERDDDILKYCLDLNDWIENRVRAENKPISIQEVIEHLLEQEYVFWEY